MKKMIACAVAMVSLPAWGADRLTEPVLFPENGATEVNVDTHLTLTFSDVPTVGTKGRICVYDAETGALIEAFSSDAVIIRDKRASIYLHDNLLDYGRTYYVTIDKGVIAGYDGIKGKKAWRITTKHESPDRRQRQLTVAADGSGDFSSLYGAMGYVPSSIPSEKRRWTVYVKNGDYEEQACFRNKDRVTIEGESRDGVRIHYAIPSGQSAVAADNCLWLQLKNLTLETTATGQNPEPLINGSHNYCENLHIIGSGEALQANGSCYWLNCVIDGDGDTILGRGPSFFRDCTLLGQRRDVLIARNDSLLAIDNDYREVLDWPDGGSLTPYADDPAEPRVRIETSMGDITVRLFNDTPRHRDNFLRLVREGYYDGTLFHRVIERFMIQGGDPDSKGAPAGVELGNGGPGYTVEAEFRPWHLHRRGALAAARESDEVNPEKRSGGSQFYIVWGKSEQGTPHLDGAYTVFGRVEEGLDVVERIQQVKTDGLDRPIEDVVVRRMTVL